MDPDLIDKILEILTFKNLAVKIAAILQKFHGNLDNPPGQGERLLLVSPLVAGGAGRHVAQQHVIERTEFTDPCPDTLIHDIAVQKGKPGAVALGLNLPEIEINAYHETLRSYGLSRIHGPAPGLTAKVENLVPLFEKTVLLLRLLKLVHRAGWIAVLLRLFEIKILDFFHRPAALVRGIDGRPDYAGEIPSKSMYI